jgi:hypothetical protein
MSSEVQLIIGSRLLKEEEINNLNNNNSVDQNRIVFVQFLERDLEKLIHSVVFQFQAGCMVPNPVIVCSGEFHVNVGKKLLGNLEIQVSIFFENGVVNRYSHLLDFELEEKKDVHLIDRQFLTPIMSLQEDIMINICVNFPEEDSTCDLVPEDITKLDSRSLVFRFESSNIWKYGVENFVESINCTVEGLGNDKQEWNLTKSPWLFSDLPLNSTTSILFNGTITFVDKSEIKFTYTIRYPINEPDICKLTHRIYRPSLNIVPRIYLFNGTYKIRYKLRKLGFVEHPITFAMLMLPSETPVFIEATVNDKFVSQIDCKVQNGSLHLSFGNYYSGEYNGEEFIGTAPNGTFHTTLIGTQEFNSKCQLNWLAFLPLNTIERTLLSLTKELVQRYGFNIWYFPPEVCDTFVLFSFRRT